MIIGMLTETQQIESICPYFKQIFDYVKNHDLLAAAPGRIDVDGENAWINVDEVTGRDRDSAHPETHNHYIDIQILLSGNETFGWSPRKLMHNEIAPYDSARDITFYSDASQCYFPLALGEFVIFFPEDAHTPCIGEGSIKKIVAKIKCENRDSM